MVSDLTGKMLQEFIKTFGASLDPRVWVTFVQEETEEVLEALEALADNNTASNTEHLLKEATDLMYVQIGFNLVSVGAEQLGLFSDQEHAEIMTKITKAQAVYEKALNVLGDVNLFEAFRRVHLSNMSKLGEDGLPIRREDGKILKGPNYVEPKLGDLLE
jgi:predicted HAD superfamily Cof-like phosphohydrolase